MGEHTSIWYLCSGDISDSSSPSSPSPSSLSPSSSLTSLSSGQNGGGDRYLEEIPLNAQKFAARVKKNVEDWNFDGVDFFNMVRGGKENLDKEVSGIAGSSV